MLKKEVVLVLIILFCTSVYAASSDFKINVNGKEVRLNLVLTENDGDVFGTIIVEKDGFEISRKKENLGTKLEMIEILKLDPGEYYATAIIERNGEEESIEKSFIVSAPEIVQKPLRQNNGVWLPFLFLLVLIMLVTVLTENNLLSCLKK